MPAQISLYMTDNDPNRAGISHDVHDLGAWLDANEWSSEELNEVLTAFSEGRLYHGGGGAGVAWAAKLYEPFDEQLDPWSRECPDDSEGVGYAAGYAYACGYHD